MSSGPITSQIAYPNYIDNILLLISAIVFSEPTTYVSIEWNARFNILDLNEDKLYIFRTLLKYNAYKNERIQKNYHEIFTGNIDLIFENKLFVFSTIPKVPKVLQYSGNNNL